MAISRIVRAAAVVALAAVALSGCALQADWDGSKKLASEECRLAAELFGLAEDEARAELAQALRPHLPDELRTLLDYYAYPLPPQGLSDELDVAFVRVQTVRSWADRRLHEWAQLTCGIEVAGKPERQPDLSQMLAFESEAEGEKLIGVAGALDPDHAVSLCEEVRTHEPHAQIEVTDIDSFPLAFATSSGSCAYHPILFAEPDEEL